MKFIRSIAADLVDKRLVPVVAVLVALAVAIPLGATVFAGGGSSKAAPVTAGKTISLPKGTPSPAKALEDIAGPNIPKAKHYTTPELNPFRNSAVSATAAAQTTAAVAVTPAAASSAAGAKTTATPKATVKAVAKKVAPKVTVPVKKPTPAPVHTTPSSAGAPVAHLSKLTRVDSYGVDVKVSDATGTRTLSNLRRLSPVPSATNALAEYLGVAKSGRAADFVLNRGVLASGPGVCLPSTGDCQVLEAQAGSGRGPRSGRLERDRRPGHAGRHQLGRHRPLVGRRSPHRPPPGGPGRPAADARGAAADAREARLLGRPGVVSLLGNLGNTVAGILNNGS